MNLDVNYSFSLLLDSKGFYMVNFSRIATQSHPKEKEFLVKKLIVGTIVTLVVSGLTWPGMAKAATTLKTYMGQSVQVKLGDIFNSTSIHNFASEGVGIVRENVEYTDPNTSETSTVYSSSRRIDTMLDDDYISNFSVTWKTNCQASASQCIWALNSWYALGGHYKMTISLETDYTEPDSTEVPVAVQAANLISLTSKQSIIYPFKDNYRDGISGRIKGVTPNGFPLKTRGITVTASINGKVVGTTKSATSGNFNLVVPPDASGNLTLDSGILHKKTYGVPSTLVSKTPVVSAKKTSITSIKLSAPAIVYPSKDGFQDSATIGIRTFTSVGKAVKSSGKLTVTQGKKIILSKKFKGSPYKSFTWNGKVNGQIVPGKYLVTTTIKGGQGQPLTAKRNISVSPKKLKTVTVNETYGAYNSFYDDQGDSYDPVSHDGQYGARFYSSGDPDTMLLTIAVPKSPSAKKWRISFNNYSAYGFFTADPCSSEDCLSDHLSVGSTTFTDGDSGTKWTPWTYAGQGSDTAYFMIGSTDWASLYVDTFTIQYSKTVLR